MPSWKFYLLQVGVQEISVMDDLFDVFDFGQQTGTTTAASPAEAPSAGAGVIFPWSITP